MHTKPARMLENKESVDEFAQKAMGGGGIGAAS
jgi:hypothetical protein